LSREEVQEQQVSEGLLSREDILEDQFIGETIATLVMARREGSLSQNDLARVSGVTQPIISRFERDGTDPRVSTLIRLLAPFGKTLAVVPIAPENEAKGRHTIAAM